MKATTIASTVSRWPSLDFIPWPSWDWVREAMVPLSGRGRLERAMAEEYPRSVGTRRMAGGTRLNIASRVYRM